ncbi:MAG: hypothetical protein RR424_10450 [Oscillospiraceae bacterium]
MKKAMIILISTIIVLGICVNGYIFTQHRKKEAAEAVQAASIAQVEETKAKKEAEEKAKADAEARAKFLKEEELRKTIANAEAKKEKEEAAAAKKEADEKETAYTKPSVPSEPPKVADGTDITNPDKKPEYTPEAVKPENNKPQKPSEPVPGTIKDGMIYVGGSIGWLPDEGVGGTHNVADFELSGELVGY